MSRKVHGSAGWLCTCRCGFLSVPSTFESGLVSAMSWYGLGFMVLARGGGRNEAVSFPRSRDLLAHDQRSLRGSGGYVVVCGNVVIEKCPRMPQIGRLAGFFSLDICAYQSTRKCGTNRGDYGSIIWKWCMTTITTTMTASRTFPDSLILNFSL